MITIKRYRIFSDCECRTLSWEYEEDVKGLWCDAKEVTELEQELKDSELRRKDLLTSLQRANAQKAELEQQNKQMLEYLKECYKRFKEYELDVDIDRPYHHINFMKKIEEVLK